MGQDLVDNLGEILEAVVQGVADFLAPEGGQAQADDESQHHGGDGVQDGRDRNGEEGRQALAGGLGQFIQHPGTDEGREQGVSHREGEGASHQSGTVGDDGGNQEQLSCPLGQIGDPHGYVGQDHQRNDEFQEIAEDAGKGNDGTADIFRQILSNKDTNDNGNDDFWYKTEFHENVTSPELAKPCPAGWDRAFDFSVYSVYYGYAHKSN